MARDRKDKRFFKKAELVEPMIEEPVEQKEASENKPENKVKFLVWFSGALSRFEGLKPHHMSAIKTYFAVTLKMGELDTEDEFDKGLEKFGYGRK